MNTATIVREKKFLADSKNATTQFFKDIDYSQLGVGIWWGAITGIGAILVIEFVSLGGVLGVLLGIVYGGLTLFAGALTLQAFMNAFFHSK